MIIACYERKAPAFSPLTNFLSSCNHMTTMCKTNIFWFCYWVVKESFISRASNCIILCLCFLLQKVMVYLTSGFPGGNWCKRWDTDYCQDYFKAGGFLDTKWRIAINSFFVISDFYCHVIMNWEYNLTCSVSELLYYNVAVIFYRWLVFVRLSRDRSDRCSSSSSLPNISSYKC